jgi:hypothetical protein
MITYHLEPLHEMAPEGIDKLSSHFEGYESSYGKLNMDWDYYLAASYAGQCKAVTVRDDGKLVGYALFFIGHNPDHKHIIQATNSGIYLDEKYRGKVSLQLLRKSDEFMKELGAHEINYLLKDDRIGRLLGRNGYKSDHRLWSIKV